MKLSRTNRWPVGLLELAVASLAVWIVCGPTGLPGAEPKERILCDIEDPENDCPGPDCRCVEDRLEITFDGDSDSIFEYQTFEMGTPIEAVLVLDVQSEHTQGWSYGVAHDDGFLEVLSATSEGTDVEFFRNESSHFVLNNVSDVQTCLNERCSRYEADGDRRDGGGFVGATVLDFMGGTELPLGRHSFSRAHYTLQQDSGTRGTTLQLTDSLALRGQSRIRSGVTIDGRSHLWTTVVDGWIRRAPRSDVPFRRGDVGVSLPGDDHPADGLINVGDAVRILSQLFWNEEGYELDCEKAADVDDDGEVTINDPVTLLRFLFMGGARPAEPFEAAGLDGTDDALTCERYR